MPTTAFTVGEDRETVVRLRLSVCSKDKPRSWFSELALAAYLPIPRVIVP